jgi:spore germination cell wall hydrolase CwlJ-like protein
MINSKKVKFFLLTLSMTLLGANTVNAATYKVVTGDTLYNIGKTFNTSAASIKTGNGLYSDMLYPGQALNVPAKDYTVKSGDTLYLISKAHNVSLYTLRKANNYWSDYVYIGQRLIIPSTSYNTVSTSTSNYSVIPYSASDLDLLARLVHAEAQGVSYKAKVAVAAVVVNRVQSSAWPNTIKDVIYQKSGGYYQFTPVVNGYIYKPASAESRQAALEALRGSDPTNGAQFYFDDSTTNKWLWSKPVALRVDNMVFSF